MGPVKQPKGLLIAIEEFYHKLMYYYPDYILVKFQINSTEQILRSGVKRGADLRSVQFMFNTFAIMSNLVAFHNVRVNLQYRLS